MVPSVFLASVVHDGAHHAARLVDGGEAVVLLPAPDVGRLLGTPDWARTAATVGDEIAIADVALAALSRPTKTICVGLNYRAHIEETGAVLPERPTLFSKFTDSLCGPNDDIELPSASSRVDWEAELTVVIGREARRVGVDAALRHVAGYTVANDTSMRDWQRRTTQWMQGKNFEASTPIAGVMATPDEVDHARDLRLTCTVDGETMQDARTNDLLFGPAELVSYISTFTTLHPGDLILTGTPAGVGDARDPKRFIAAGEIVVVTLEGVADCRNRFVGDPG
jgi:acylpyruvate hydrolase